MTLNEHIKLHYGGNRAKFARKLDVSNVTMGRYCSGETEPDALMKEEIKKATDGEVTLDDMHQTRLEWLKRNGRAVA